MFKLIEFQIMFRPECFDIKVSFYLTLLKKLQIYYAAPLFRGRPNYI
jgi:hypothetical protein